MSVLKKLSWPLLALSVLVFSYFVLAGNQEERKMIYVEGFSKGAVTEVRVNDIPVGRIEPNGQMYTQQIERQLLTGKNTITITPQAEKGASAIRVSEYPEGVFVDGKGGKEIGRTQTANGKTVAFEFSLEGKRPEWQWIDTDIVHHDTDLKEAEAFVKQAYNHLANAEADQFTPLLEPLFCDLALHDPSLSKKDRLAGFKQKLSTRKGQDIWQFTNIQDIELVLTPVANGHLIKVTRKDGSPVFRTAQEKSIERITYYNVIGRKDGKWGFYF